MVRYFTIVALLLAVCFALSALSGCARPADMAEQRAERAGPTHFAPAPPLPEPRTYPDAQNWQVVETPADTARPVGGW